MAFISEKAVGGTEGVETIEPGQRRLNFLQRMFHFYNAPVVKFFIYIVSLFLLSSRDFRIVKCYVGVQ